MVCLFGPWTLPNPSTSPRLRRSTSGSGSRFRLPVDTARLPVPARRDSDLQSRGVYHRVPGLHGPLLYGDQSNWWLPSRAGHPEGAAPSANVKGIKKRKRTKVSSRLPRTRSRTQYVQPLGLGSGARQRDNATLPEGVETT